jgi:hypothetical protein
MTYAYLREVPYDSPHVLGSRPGAVEEVDEDLPSHHQLPGQHPIRHPRLKERVLILPGRGGTDVKPSRGGEAQGFMLDALISNTPLEPSRVLLRILPHSAAASLNRTPR